MGLTIRLLCISFGIWQGVVIFSWGDLVLAHKVFWRYNFSVSLASSSHIKIRVLFPLGYHFSLKL